MSRVAAIDCGTNSIRLLVADLTVREDGSRWLRDVHREMRVVRLGQGVDATGLLAPEALARTRTALADYAAIIARKGAQRARMVATSATRDARNRDEFFSMTTELLGVPAEVITGDEEARLTFLGAVGDCEPDDGPFVVTDVGGGSTELVLGTWDGLRAEVRAMRSVDVGCVRLTERHLHTDPPTTTEIAAAERFVDETLAPAFDAVPLAGARTWVGVSGTAVTLAGVVQDLPDYDSEATHLYRMPMDAITKTTNRLLAMTHEERARLPVIHPGRVDVIGGGALVVRTLGERFAEQAAIGEMLVSEHDILDGIALSLDP